MRKKIIGTIAATLAVALAFAFLGGMAIKIGEAPLLIIIFAVLFMIGWDFVDTTRASLRNGDGNGAKGAEN